MAHETQYQGGFVDSVSIYSIYAIKIQAFLISEDSWNSLKEDPSRVEMDGRHRLPYCMAEFAVLLISSHLDDFTHQYQHAVLC